MTFAHPWLLLGALAAFIPLLIHLFDRRRPRPVSFPAIAFVLKSQKRTASRLRLKRLILYTLRTLFFLAVPIALARPEFVKSATAVTAKGAAAIDIFAEVGLVIGFLMTPYSPLSILIYSDKYKYELYKV